MDFLNDFPYRVLINLDRRPDRLVRSLRRLDRAGVSVERLPAVDAQNGAKSVGFANVRRRACSLSFRTAMRRAEQLGKPSVLAFEDDVVLHPRFLELVNQVELPSDWEVFYFGGFHVEKPIPLSHGLVKCRKNYGCHAVAFRAVAFRKIRKYLRSKVLDGTRIMNNDEKLTEMVKRCGLRAYACYPNLAWQEFGYSNLCEKHYSMYDVLGRQIQFRHLTKERER